jgi:hypothetical protein
MRTMLLFVVAFVFQVSLSSVTRSFTQDQCACPGQRVDHFAEGDGRPINWPFDAYLISGGGSTTPHVSCFVKEVTNRSNLDIYSVRWDVADYRQLRVYKGTTLASCPQYLGEIGQIQIHGPLNYGISSSHYDTTVKAPSGGWHVQAASSGESPTIEAGRDWPRLESQFAFAALDKEGKPSSGRITITSGVVFKDSKFARLQYTVENSGTEPAFVMINLTTTKDALKSLPIADSFIENRSTKI